MARNRRRVCGGTGKHLTTRIVCGHQIAFQSVCSTYWHLNKSTLSSTREKGQHTTFGPDLFIVCTQQHITHGMGRASERQKHREKGQLVQKQFSVTQ